jgi:phthiocerol/phenolphthiocerol synthesis type-I polyketide synthase B
MTGSASASVAIIGIGCRFPGGVTDPTGFWNMLAAGGDAISEIPRDRIDVDHYFNAEPATPGRMATRLGGFLDGIDLFDAGFFGISPREAERLDPQQRLLLETAWEAIEDAGQDLRRLDARRCAVFVGQWMSDFEARLFADPAALDFHMTTGSGRYAASGRLSYALGFRGPSLTIDTACSSSLAAVHLAVRSIRTGESQLALAGGVNIILQPHINIAYSQSRMMAADGRCKFGDASGDGYVRSEGAGLVALKPLRDAVADGDRIYAVIRGSAVNNDGCSSGSLGRPSRAGQVEVLRAAYADAGVLPARVGYAEAHGTGTRVGDPVEVGALAAVLGEGREPGDKVHVGSVKTNIGHTEAAAGIAGLIKAALALHHGAIPPSLHCRVPNPAIPWSSIPCTIPRTLVPWPEDGSSRVAGVSGYGISGTNGHVVLESAAPATPAGQGSATRALSPLPLSARSTEALRALATRYADLLTGAGLPHGQHPPALYDVCWNAAVRRTPLDHRAVFVAAAPDAMAERLRGYAAGETASAEGVVHAETRPRLAFVLPGQGAQWIGMGRQLLAQEPAFRMAVEECDAAARRFVDWSIIEQLGAEPGSAPFLLDRIDVIQPVLVALAIAHAALLRALGVVPDAVVGHSMGEVAAACIAGVLDLDRAMEIVCRRSALMRRVSGQGAMALVDLSIEALLPHLAGLDDRVAVAASNGPRSSVISGEPEAVQLVMARLEDAGVFTRLVKVDVASHSPQMHPLATELGHELAGMRPGRGAVPIYSTVFGRCADGDAFGADYWARNMRQPVLFSAAITQMVADGVTVFLELGPHPILSPSVQQTEPAAVTIACGRREEPEQEAMLAALGALWSAGYPVDWRRVMPAGGAPVRLPLYPWQRERHWAEAAEMRPVGAAAGGDAVRRPDEAVRGWLYRFAWPVREPSPAAADAARAATRWLVLSGNERLAGVTAGALALAGVNAGTAPLDGLEATLAQRASGAAPPEAIVVIADTSTDAGFLPLRVLQACLAADLRPRLWFVTRGAQTVEVEPLQHVAVEQAALWGAARVIAEERPELWGGLVDLDPAESDQSAGVALAQGLMSQDGEDQVAWRHGARHVLRLTHADREPARPAPAWRTDAAYLITGGLGAIGQQIARAMVASGARRLILMSRTELPPRAAWSSAAPDSDVGRRIAAMRALEAMGAAVHTPAVDVSNKGALRAFLDAYAAEGWPPIRGVFHTAVSLSNRLAEAMDRATFDSVVTSKLRAAQLLDDLLPELDHFVVFSSIGGFLPHPGVANYAAANAGLDALAEDRRARGQPALSIAWGPWSNAGLALGEAGAHAVSEMARQGIQAIPPETAAKLCLWLCGQSGAFQAVMPVDWSRLRAARSGRPLRLFDDVLADLPVATAEQSDIPARLAAAAPAERRRILENVTRSEVGRVLKLAPTRLDPRKTLGSMGLSSLLAIELRNHLETVIGRPLLASLAWNYPTIEAIVGHLLDVALGMVPGADPSASGPDVATALPPGFADVATMSEEAALLALLQRPADVAQ